MQSFSVDFCCSGWSNTTRRNIQKVYLFIFLYIFSDGEIISQIKMTNIALAEIKELLKQQVKAHVRQTGLGFKGKKK